jgi:hypothetical protein
LASKAAHGSTCVIWPQQPARGKVFFQRQLDNCFLGGRRLNARDMLVKYFTQCRRQPDMEVVARLSARRSAWLPFWFFHSLKCSCNHGDLKVAEFATGNIIIHGRI